MSLEEARRAYAVSLAEYIGQRMGISTDRIFEPERGEQNISQARQLLCYALRDHGWTLYDIGTVVARDHSTVSHAIARIHSRLRVDAELRSLYTSMPRSDVRVFTEPSLVELYNRLTRALAEAQSYSEQIQRRLNEESVPRRVPTPIESRTAGWRIQEALG